MAKIESISLEGKKSIAVLLCHTLAETPEQMKELAKKLNKNGYHVSCPLYKGHGGEFEELIQTNVEDWYQDVENAYHALQKQGLDVFVLGMSIGGSMAVKLAEQQDVKGLITVNAPIIGFDIETDVFNFKKTTGKLELADQYREHRTKYFHFAVELGQTDNIKKITCPLFVLQGSLDLQRYKTSSHMLMSYVSSEVKQRKDYGRSRHLLLLEPDKKEAIKDIIKFISENE